MIKNISSVNRKPTVFWFIAIFMAIIIIEIFLQIVYFIAGMNIDKTFLFHYKTKEWGKAYFQEYNERKWKFVPFILWQSEQYHGKYINIDSRGVRKTWNKEIRNEEQYKIIYCFGGSSMFGQGARDDYTIPSHIAKLLHKDHKNNIVYNYGEDGFTFLQEIIYLVLLLKDGHKPNYVIFYDGANDVYAAYQSGKPGTILNQPQIKKRWDSRSLPLVLSILSDVFQRRCMIYVALDRLTTILFSKPRFSEVGASYDDNQLKRLSEETVEEYLKSKKILDQLAKLYGFQYYCFWQPVIYTENKKLPGDGKGDPRSEDKALKNLHKYTNNLLKEKLTSNFINISDAIENRAEVFYIDAVHLTENGNEKIAERIYSTIENDLVMPSSPNK